MNIEEEIAGCKFDLIKIALNGKAKDIKELEELRSKLLLADKLRKECYNANKVNNEELEEIQNYISSNIPKRK